jgi:hypothetical protein
VSDRVSRAVELTSIVVIGLCLLAFGWLLLQNLTHFPGPSSALLVAVAVLEFFSLRSNAMAEGSQHRVRASRDAAFLVASLLALAFVLSPQRWMIGACVSMVEFGILLELLARTAPA